MFFLVISSRSSVPFAEGQRGLEAVSAGQLVHTGPRTDRGFARRETFSEGCVEGWEEAPCFWLGAGRGSLLNRVHLTF